jgi:hypothetical protein
MRILKTLTAVVLMTAVATVAAAATGEMTSYVPNDAKGVVETVNAAGLRADLLDSAFWAGLEQTPGFKEWRASEKYKEMRDRLDKFLANLDMPQDEAVKAYLGGRTVVAMLPAGGDKPRGVILTETTTENANKLIKACGGVEEKKYRDVPIYQVVCENKTDRMAYTDGLLIVSDSSGDQIEKVLDVKLGSAPALAADGNFIKATAPDGLAAGWRVRAYGAQVPPRKGPGAATLYPKGNGRVHFEWQLVGGESLFALSAPVDMQAPKILPSNAVAAVSTAAHLTELWDFAKTKVAGQSAKAQQKLLQFEMFWRGMFPGQTMDAITAAFGPEAAAAILKGEGEGAAPGAIVAIRLAQSGKTMADNFRQGLAAKAMLVASLTANNPDAPQITVTEEAYGDAQLLVVEAPKLLDKFFGDWAKDAAITVAVTNDWLIVGTTPSGVKRTLDTIAGKAKSLGAALTEAGETVPTKPATRWGVILPQGVSDILIGWAEKLAGKQGAEKIKKMTNLAEAMKLLKYVGFLRTDTEAAIQGQADIQAIQ